jgi:hypothetical protein
MNKREKADIRKRPKSGLKASATHAVVAKMQHWYNDEG